MLLRRIIRHEIRDIVRDGRFRAVSAVLLGMLLVGLMTGWSYREAVSAEHASAEQTSRDTWEAQPAKDPHSAAHYGAYAFKPRGALTLFDNGVNPYTGVAAWLEAHKQNEFQFRPAQDRASVARLGHVTTAATLQWLVPIVIVLLAFTKVAGEREDGTLRQLAASGVSPRLLAAGKAGGVALALGAVLVPAAVLGALALVWTSGVAADDTARRVGALACAYGLYFAIFIALGIAASAVARTSSHALAILIAFWALNVILAPRVASDISRQLYPVPTAFEFAQSIQHDMYDGRSVHDYNVLRAVDLRERLLRQHHVTRVEDLPVNFRGVDYLEREAHADQVWERHYGELWTAFARQVRLHEIAGFVAPYMAVRSVSMALTATDFSHHQHFARAAEAYRRRLVLAMNSDLAFGGTSEQRGGYAAPAAFWSSVPPFDYQQPDVAWSMAHGRTGLVALVTWFLVAATALMLGLRRLVIE